MSQRNAALVKYHFCVEDENGNPIISGLRVSIFTAGSTAATVYADAYGTALTNPITSTVFGTNSGAVEFWYGGPTCDVMINDGIGRIVSIPGITPSDNRVIFDTRQAVGGVLGNNTATELVDVAGTFVDYIEQVTIDGSLLRANDVIRINCKVLAADFHTEEELDIKLQMIDSATSPNTLLLMHTGDVVIAANADYVEMHVDMKVITAGSSGKVRWSGLMWTNLNGTLALKNGTVEDGMSAAGSSLDTTGNLLIKASGDYKNAHADQESYAYIDVQVIKGVIVTT